MKNVYELTGSLNGIEEDVDLTFPNVLTCIAIGAFSAGGLVGAHATTADRSRMLKVADALRARSVGTPEIYVIGPVVGYNLSPLTNAGPVRFYRCDGGIDVFMSYSGGGMEFGTRPTGSDGDFTSIPVDSFS